MREFALGLEALERFVAREPLRRVHECVFGGALTALRYPERELVATPALKTYYEPLRPLEPAPTGALSMQ